MAVVALWPCWRKLIFGSKPTHPHLTEVDFLLKISDTLERLDTLEWCVSVFSTLAGAPVCRAWVPWHVQVGITEAVTSVDNANTSGHTMTIQAATL